jgi:hypothetical protein
MDARGQIYFDQESKISEEDQTRYLEALRKEKILFDRAAMREAIETNREQRGLAPIRGAEEEIVPEAS